MVADCPICKVCGSVTVQVRPGEYACIVTHMAPENPKKSHGDLKPQLQTIPPPFLIELAKALGEGAAKYGSFNWREIPIRSTDYVGAAMRHLLAYMDGENVDPESTTGKTHLAGAAAALAILIDAHATGVINDDRPRPGPAAEMLRAPGFKGE